MPITHDARRYNMSPVMRQDMGDGGWIERRAEGLVWLCFEGWDGVQCLHSTRMGGSSPPPFDTLNLGGSVGDSERNVQENRRKFQRAAGIGASRLILNRQVHSDKVNVVSEPQESLEGDALLTQHEDIPLAVSVADCLAIYVHDAAHAAVGLIHAGRRGTLKEIASKTLLKMEEALGCRASDCSVLFGPAIGPCCYEVGPDIAQEFEDRFPGSIIVRDPGRGTAGSRLFLDLARANELQLRRIGVEDIVTAGLCTSCREDLFFSHRRDGGRTGRMLAIIRRIS